MFYKTFSLKVPFFQPADQSINTVHGRGYYIRKTHLRTLLNLNLESFYHRSEGFLMISIQNVCGKAILMCLIPFFGRGKLSALRPPCMVKHPSNEGKEVLIHIQFNIVHCYHEFAYITWQIAQTLMRRRVKRCLT